MNSWMWNTDSMSLATVFVTPGWASKIDYQDLSTVLSLWDNCKEYNISPNVIKKLREIRNSYFAHNSKIDVSDDKLTNIFNILGVLFHEKDLINYVNVTKCLRKLQKIKTAIAAKYDDTDAMGYLLSTHQIQLENNESLKEIKNSLEYVETKIESFGVRGRKPSYCNCSCKLVMCIGTIIPLIVMLGMYLVQNSQPLMRNSSHQSSKRCKYAS